MVVAVVGFAGNFVDILVVVGVSYAFVVVVDTNRGSERILVVAGSKPAVAVAFEMGHSW